MHQTRCFLIFFTRQLLPWAPVNGGVPSVGRRRASGSRAPYAPATTLSADSKRSRRTSEQGGVKSSLTSSPWSQHDAHRVASAQAARDAAALLDELATLRIGADETSASASPSTSNNALKLAPSRTPAGAATVNERERWTMQSASTGESALSGSDFAALERIERRRYKWSVAESEFDVGTTERLFPEIRRLVALHEVHHGDAVVREVDARIYFERLDGKSAASLKGDVERMTSPDDRGGESPERRSADSEMMMGLSETADLDDEAFARFDAEAGKHFSAPETVPLDVDPVGGRDGVACVTVAEDALSIGDETVHHGNDTPWFVPPSGVIRLLPLPPQDCLRLLKFLLSLRGMTEADVPASLRRRIATTRAQEDVIRGDGPPATPAADLLTLQDLHAFLDGAPAPVMGFTECLHPRETFRSPAFVFTLYLENVSSQNAVGHLAALFSIPLKSIATHTAASKLSSTSLLCAVERNRVLREHLLLVNTMRHPGFVIRIGSVQEVHAPGEGETSASAAHATGEIAGDVVEEVGRMADPQAPASDLQRPSKQRPEDLFGELARWQPLYEVDMLLRRVSCSSRQDLDHRLRALQQVGAVFFCANREASLARAATDVLHGFYKSAIINALYRRKAPLALQHFLTRPNPVTAARARRASTDSTVRQVLKVFIATDGDWQHTVARTPYVWRRRWINALRSLVWNTMASRRLRAGGRAVLVGDVVFKPEYRSDAQRRMLTTVKAEHVKVVMTEEEAERFTLEDVCIPFLRGQYPSHLFASEESKHPIMTREAMLALLREMHAQPILLGLSDVSRTLLDIRSDVSPVLFRRLLLRPVSFSYSILEDKVPIKSTQFDSARVLWNDRWASAAPGRYHCSESSPAHPGDGPVEDQAPASALVPQSVVLENSSIGAYLTRGHLAEEFFALPGSEQYSVLGHAKRYLEGDFTHASPSTPEEERGDRLYTVHLHAITRSGAAGLAQMLREYFVLVGVEEESDSALQHKIHRVRCELDPETPLLTAPSYCAACYNRDHDHIQVCAEYQFKRDRRASQQLRSQTLLADTEAVRPGGVPSSSQSQSQETMLKLPPTSSAHTASAALSPLVSTVLTMRWVLQRRSVEGKWGVHLTKSLRLVGIEDVKLIRSGELSVSRGRPLAPHVAASAAVVPSDDVPEWPSFWIAAVRQAKSGESSPVSCTAKPAAGVSSDMTTPEALAGLLSQLFSGEELDRYVAEGGKGPAAALPLPSDPKRLECFGVHKGGDTVVPSLSNSSEKDYAILRHCAWQLRAINGSHVHNRREVAVALVSLSKQREVEMHFELLASPLHVEDTSSQALVAHVSAPSEGVLNRTMQTLPKRLELTVAKHRALISSSVSWGLQLQTTTMLLVNLGYMVRHIGSAAPAQAAAGRRTKAYPVSIVSLPDRTASQQADGIGTDEASLSVPPALAELAASPFADHLNRAYAVVQIDTTRVRTVADAAEALRSFQLSVQRSGQHRENATKGDGKSEVRLRIVLELYTSSQHAQGHEKASVVASGDGRRCGEKEMMGLSVNAPKHVQGGSSEVVTVGNDVSGVAPGPHCVLLSESQASQQVVTIAINRRILCASTRGRWGMRVQLGTLRLKHVQHNKYFTFQVFATKRTQASRIADTLRYHGGSDAAPGGSADHVVDHSISGLKPALAAGKAVSRRGGSGGAAFSSYFIYMLQAVNQHAVLCHDELRAALGRAALGGDGWEHAAPESVTLQVRQYQLVRFSLPITRGGVDEASALAPVGLHVNNSMCIVAVEPGSPAAQAIVAVASEHCTLRRRIRAVSKSTKAVAENRRAEDAMLTEEDAEREWVTHPVLIKALRHCAPNRAGGLLPRDRQSHNGSSTPKRKRAWEYSLDEDAIQELKSTGTVSHDAMGASSVPAGSSAASSLTSTDWFAQLEQMWSTFGRLNMVDGVDLLQAALLRDYVHRQATRGAGTAKEGSEADADEEQLCQRLRDAHHQVTWRVVYAAKAGRAVRSTSDLSAVLAPGVTEETLVVQQCLKE